MHMTDKEYNRYVAGLAKKSPLWKDLLNSFWIGGLICALGQLIGNGWKMAGLDKDAGSHGDGNFSGIFKRTVYGAELV